MIRRDVRALLSAGLKKRPVPIRQKVLDEEEMTFNPKFDEVVKNIEKVPPSRPKLLKAETPDEEAWAKWQEHANGVQLRMSQVVRLFGVTNMTLYHWIKRLGLPRKKLAGGRNPPVRFDEGMILAWAKQHNKAVAFTDYREWD